jgi:hypothetical protein
MKMNRSLLALGILLLILGSIDAYHQSSFDDEAQPLQQEHRFLAPVAATTSCGPNHYYETTITLESQDALSCTTAALTTIGKELDKAFDDVVDIDQALADIELDTLVCAAATKRRRSLRAERENEGRNLATQPATPKLKFNWSGGGKCNLCTPDNADKRRGLVTMLAAAGEDHNEEDGIAHHPRELREAYAVIDFNTDGKGNNFTARKGVQDVVYDEWHAQYGMKITVEARTSASSLTAPGLGGKKILGLSNPLAAAAMIFDSSNPLGYAKHLGSPNKLCPGGGPGRGAAGGPGMVGENCVDQGNVLTVQDPKRTVMDRDLVFTFESPTRVGHIGIMGSTGTSWLEVESYNGDAILLNFTGLGDNGVQIVHVDYVVERIKVVMTSPGAVTEIGIFTPTTASQALSATARSFLQNKSPFAELIPYLEFDLSYYLTRHINEVFGTDTNSCLFDKWVTIDVKLESVEKKPSTKC